MTDSDDLAKAKYGFQSGQIVSECYLKIPECIEALRLAIDCVFALGEGEPALPEADVPPGVISAQ